MIAQAVQLEGEAQREAQKAFALKRKHEQMMQQIEAIDSLTKNDNTVVFGAQDVDIMSQVGSFMVSQNLFKK